MTRHKTKMVKMTDISFISHTPEQEKDPDDNKKHEKFPGGGGGGGKKLIKGLTSSLSCVWCFLVQAIFHAQVVA